MLKLQFQKLDAAAQLPCRTFPTDAGYDLQSVQSLWLVSHGRALVGTGLAVAIPEGHYGRIAPRSGLAVNSGIDVGAGVVDSGYRGELRVLLFNHSAVPFEVTAGAKIAQLIIEPIATPPTEWADELPSALRGTKGFGSSGD